MYLRRCLPGSEDLCDLILVAGQERFPAHSQYLASHSHFIRQLILETGPSSWQHPLIIDKILHGHSSASVQLLLFGVYNLSILSIGSPDLAWQLSKLTDQLNCPSMLRHCRVYLNQMPMCQADDALHWLTVTAHEAELEGLHANCASKIAADFDRVAKDKCLTSLSTAHLMRIMAVMSHQNASQLQANKQMCQVCRQSEQQAFRLGRKRKLLAATCESLLLQTSLHLTVIQSLVHSLKTMTLQQLLWLQLQAQQHHRDLLLLLMIQVLRKKKDLILHPLQLLQLVMLSLLQ